MRAEDCSERPTDAARMLSELDSSVKRLRCGLERIINIVDSIELSDNEARWAVDEAAVNLLNGREWNDNGEVLP